MADKNTRNNLQGLSGFSQSANSTVSALLAPDPVTLRLSLYLSVFLLSLFSPLSFCLVIYSVSFIPLILFSVSISCFHGRLHTCVSLKLCFGFCWPPHLRYSPRVCASEHLLLLCVSLAAHRERLRHVSICGCIIREHVWSQNSHWIIEDIWFVIEKKGKKVGLALKKILNIISLYFGLTCFAMTTLCFFFLMSVLFSMIV